MRLDGVVSLLYVLPVVAFVSSDATDNIRLLGEVTIPQATLNSKTFALVDAYDCKNSMVRTVRTFFKANKALIDVCITESGYQIYPFTGSLPDSAQVQALVHSHACLSVISAVVWLNTPPCMIDGLAMRAACETLLYYAEELKDGAMAPTSEEFDDVLTWRRDVDLAKAAKKPYDKTSPLYAKFTHNVERALAASKVSVLENATIAIDGEVAPRGTGVDEHELQALASTNASTDFFVGRVRPDATTYKTVLTRSSNSLTGTHSPLCGLAFLVIGLALI
ncbi:hypothetical protein PsorP6_016485 [Peronosclerospora sorghi]|uniref:Uncharacterized protein n=1 Tax=Peronosclerospora sorghi TaxID=230839 RepID=A0ACC0VK35_9STRA|nr:hypothetical protein PsorP6_016485 [Peronosclerospora sorghi]